MAKNTKNNLYDIEKENKDRKKNKKKLKKKSNNKNQSNERETISLDNEIIIGVTNVSKEQNLNSKNKKKVNKKKEKKSIKKNSNQNVKNKKQPIKNKNIKREKVNKNVDEEIVEKIILDEEDFIEQRKVERKEKRRRKFKIAKIIMIVGLLLTTILLIMFSPLFNIKEITVEGNELISTEQILSLAGIEKESNTFKLNIGKISDKIKEDLYIEEAEINRELPSKVTIKIKERKPSFLIEYANGYAVIDRKGMILELITEKKDLPILQGLETTNDKFEVGKKLENNDLNKIYIVSKIIDAANNCDIAGLITRIDIENKKEVKLIIESKGKTAYIGDDKNLNDKLSLVKGIMEKTEGQAGEIFVNGDLNSEYPVFRERV